MHSLLLLIASLAAAHRATRARVRRRSRAWQKPADLWTEADVQAWTALIQPFPMPEKEEPAWPAG